jgi:hypothetical protein
VQLAFRPRLEGIENLPRDRPFMLVSNHSGLGLAEIMALIVSLLDRIGTSIRIAPMVHPLSMNAWPAGGWMRRLGAIPSTYDDANAALANGISVLVFPGISPRSTQAARRWCMASSFMGGLRAPSPRDGAEQPVAARSSRLREVTGGCAGGPRTKILEENSPTVLRLRAIVWICAA